VDLDAFDAVRRTFFESWHLAFQFRLENTRGEIGRWFALEPDSWSAEDACENSAAVIATKTQRLDPGDQTLAEAIASFETEPAALLYRLLWVALCFRARSHPST
jgi:hypothetical protein